jgi:hypothetical protein
MPVRYELRSVRNDVIVLTGPIHIRTVDGLGMPEIDHLAQRNAQAHGDQWIDYRVRGRTVTFGLETLACEQDKWAAWSGLTQLMGELMTGFRLRSYLPDGQRRQVDLRFASGLTFPWDRMDNLWLQTMAMQCRTYGDPSLYDPDIVNLAYSVAGGAGSWGFPLGFPAGFGTGILAIPASLTYPGTWRSFPTFTIGGPGDGIKIENATTGEKLEFDPAYAIVVGEEVVINLTPGYKTVTNSVTGNAVDLLTSDSDLGTFHLAPHPEAPGGINSISITINNTTAATYLLVDYYVRYLSI